MTTDVLARLEQLETAHRRLARANTAWRGLALILLGCLAFWPSRPFAHADAPPPSELRAQKFTLVDGTGAPRGHWGLHQDQPALILVDKHKKNRAMWHLTEQGHPHLCGWDANGRLRYELFLADAGYVGLNLRDGNGQIRQVMGINDQANPYLLQADAAGINRLQLGYFRNGDGPILKIYHDKTQEAATLGLHTDGPRLQLFDSAGKALPK
jgi:hypothetical protein